MLRFFPTFLKRRRRISKEKIQVEANNEANDERRRGEILFFSNWYYIMQVNSYGTSSTYDRRRNQRWPSFVTANLRVTRYVVPAH